MMNRNDLRKNERGMALIVALLALLLVSAVGLGMIYMSTTETSITSNYKDSQIAFFAMRGGLEEMRDRLRTTATTPVSLPTAMPGSANSIYYITNPSSVSDVVDPKTFTNTYFDDEFCHESFVGSGVTYVAPGTPCASAGAPPSGSVAAYSTSILSTVNTSASLKYKWARVTLKQNGTFPNALVDPTQTGANLSSQVCWNESTSQEVVSSALGYANCAAAANGGLFVEPIYVITSLAYTPQGSRRVGQYDVAAYNLTPPPGGLILSGNNPSFSTPHSANAGINGTDGSGTPPALAGCATTGAVDPAIGTNSAATAANVAGQIFRPSNFTGSGGTPSVVNDSAALSQWSTPAQLNTMVAEIANEAGPSNSYNCTMAGKVGGSSCSGTYGTTASPQITYLDGDVSLSGGAGVLVVTGTLTINGNMQFNGLVLVIGQGQVVINGGGHGTFYGEMFIAQTNSSTAPFSQLAAFPNPSSSFTWNGGGKSDMYYNSCWAGMGSVLYYTVVASREEMY